MEKNENGYPRTGSGAGCPGMNGNGAGNGARTGNSAVCPGMNGNGAGNGARTGNGCRFDTNGNGNISNNSNANMNGMQNGSVGGVGCQNGNCGGTMLDGMALAYVYAPDQKFCMLYSANDALKHGTLFEELYKPKEVYGRE